MDLFQQMEGRDPFEILPQHLPEPLEYKNHRQFVRKVLEAEVDLRTIGPRFVDGRAIAESDATLEYRTRLNASGSPSDAVAVGYVWQPGTELAAPYEGRAK
jgi:hypothetical protein